MNSRRILGILIARNAVRRSRWRDGADGEGEAIGSPLDLAGAALRTGGLPTPSVLGNKRWALGLRQRSAGSRSVTDELALSVFGFFAAVSLLTELPDVARF